MKLTKKLAAEIRKLYETFWESYINGDLETYASLLDEDFKFIGSTEAEPLLNKKDSIKFLEATAEQLRGSAEFRNRNIKVETVDDLILITELCDGYILIGSEWNFYSRFRLSSLLKKKKEKWKFIHQHVSMPDSKAQEGESFGLEQIRTENIQLRDAVKRRTIELENKNRELEIEAALEKVRVQALGMHKPDDLLNVCKILFKELQVLGFDNLRNAMIDTFVDEKKYLLDYDFSDFTGGSITRNAYSGSPVMEKFISEIRKSNDAFTEIAVTGKELEEWKQFRIANNEKHDPRLDSISGLYYYFYSIGVGAIGISTFSSINEEKREILKRFRNVFDLAYRRYMDVAQAEAQAREAKIEAALERARTQSMLMQHSNELNDTLQVFHQQLQLLGINSDFSYLWLPDEENDTHVFWATWEEEKNNSTVLKSKTLTYPLDRNESYTAQCLTDWKSGIPVHSYKLPPAEVENYFAAWQELLSGAEKLKAEFFPAGFDYVEAFMKYGCFGIVVSRLLTEDEKQILRRFTIEFERAYTRFLDLQKAEAQARESQIQLALERVRARTMAMHHSDELTEVVKLLYQEFDKLKINNESTDIEIGLIDEETGIASVWAHFYLSDGTISTFKIPFARFEEINNEFLQWKSTPVEKRNDLFFTTEFSSEQWDRFMRIAEELPELAEIFRPLMEAKISKWVTHNAYFSHGILTLQGTEAYSPETQEIQKRFAKVFGQTYTRFLDLKKAEAQAREAQIETALERVRSRTMGMQKSEELKEVIQVVYEQFVHLNIQVEHTGFIMDYKERDDMHIWLADKHAVPFQVTIPYFDCAHWNSFKEAKEKGIDFFVNQLSFEEKNKFYQDLFKLIPGVPEETLEYYFSCPGLAISTVLLDNVGLYIENFSGIPYTDEENNTLMRFGKVFQQTYTRFLDLQKAEAQAREAQIETALEKVRSHSMGMRSSDDLANVATVMFDQMRILGGDLFSFGIVLCNKHENMVEQWHSIPHAGMMAPFFVPVDLDYIHRYRYDQWKAGVELFSVVIPEDYIAHHFELMLELPSVKAVWEGIAAKGIPLPAIPTWEMDYGASFRYGYLLVSALKPFEEDKIFPRFAKVFEQAYTRFLDLQKAEAQAREAQIEVSLERVRSKAMAMHKTEDLTSAVSVVFDELDKLQLGMLRCGIGILHRDKRTADVWTTAKSETGTNIQTSGDEPMDIHPLLQGDFDAWLRQEDFSYVLEGKDLENYYQVLTETNFQLPESASFETIKKDHKQYYYVTPFELGTFFAFREAEFTPEAKIVMKRFANVFNLTYKRFLDLQKAEAQSREAQIELGLERVRARAMAMQKSDELSELVDTVFKELTKLDFALTWCIINIIDESSLSNTVWAANPDINKAPESYHMLFEDYPFHHAMMKGWKERKTKYVYTLEGSEKKIYDDYLFSETEFKRTPEAAQVASRAMEKYVVSFSFSNFGGLQTVGDGPLSEPSLDILSRFGKVFDLTYTRFNDLKQAEAQAREAKIEAALERVRSRAMAMHKTDELLDAAELVGRELSALGITSMNVSYAFVDDDEKYASYYSVNPVDGRILSFPFVFPHTETEVMRSILSSWKKQEPFNLIELDEEATLKHQTYIGEHIQNLIIKNNSDIPFSVEAFLAVSPQKAVIYTFNFAKGYLFNIGGERLTPMQEEMVLRFTKVFDMTYRRFLDLKQAEAQAREAQIQLAMERVRARTMAMQKSDELPEAANLLFLQVQSLGMPTWSAGYCIWDEDKKAITLWMSSEGVIQQALRMPLTEDPYLMHFREAHERGESFWVEAVGGKELKNHYGYLRTLPGLKESLDDIEAAGFPAPTFQIFHCAYFSKGFLLFITYEPVPEAHDIFKRFAKVFEQTYTRFLDLQKAEAQVREAKIEAALEKVRARTMAMQRSEELAEVATVLFQQVKALGVSQWVCGFNIWEIGDKEFTWYPGSPDGEILASCKVPLTEHPVFISFDESRRRGDELFVYEKEGEFQAGHYRYMMSLPGMRELLQGMLDTGLQFPTFQIDHLANFSHGNLVFITYEPVPEMHDVFKRFAKVFDQTYTRFLDLQKAEAQAREAVKQASVDRIRAEIASMRTTNDLERIQPLIWNELTTLGVPFTRCGVFIMDEEHKKVDTFLSTPEGRPIASFTSAYSNLAIITEALPYWRRKEIYKAHWDEATFLAQAKTLLAQGNITSTETYLTEHHPKDLHLHFLPFLQGILYVGNETPLNDDELQLVQNLADAFSIAYARYEDFNKLELAKGQIEKTLVDLKQTQAQLVQSEKMASLGELTAGIAHEIQNPLNFVNNFSDVNKELLVEMKEEIDKGNIEEVKAIANDIIGNEEKINHHGKRADAIVKGMLQHSRSSSGVKEPADINVLADEYLRLAYHGLRARDKSFNAIMKTDFDNTIGKINIVPQDIGRSVLNLITNAFYAVAEKKKQNAEGYEPTVTVTTKRINGRIEIRVADNGNGIPQKVLDKIFQPFFTTKPTGQGTGLGLSLSYDIIKAHGGEINVETKEGEGSDFFIFLPANN
jgi:signal transduction histidine kinase/ketosteroid isomerase-like protein